MSNEIQGAIRRFTKNALSNALRTVRMTGLESQAFAQVEPARFELARAGRRFHGGMQIIANGIAPVAAIPTTTGTLAFFNGEPAGGKVYAIERLGFFLGSGTPAAGATLFATVTTKAVATPPTVMATGYGVQNSSGSSPSSKGLWTTALALPGNPAPAWALITSTLQLAAANIGQGDQPQDLEGAWIVSPGFAIAFAILSGAGTTPLYGISMTHSEIDAETE